MLEAVEQREDHRTVERLGLDPVERRVEVVSLDRDDQQPDRAFEPRRRLGAGHAGPRAFHERQPVLGDRCHGSLGAHAQRPRAGGEQAADPAEAEHCKWRSGHASAGSTTRFTYCTSE